jgi:hypothetical protein
MLLFTCSSSSVFPFALLSLDSLSKLLECSTTLKNAWGRKDLVAENHIQVHQARTKPFYLPNVGSPQNCIVRISLSIICSSNYNSH